ncbi:hypothetical protein CTAYLR_003538 [Chrysophaeum taylorii]|uniref:EF-hand domain-containing protein n=1 Tax=Chrysophaeum taylorii TaxID=2483200 RepID=A0AAD7UCA5_9STRA|nr:hypothetical protein CTAYLR_003538 [Chrysophaeum taylorii]
MEKWRGVVEQMIEGRSPSSIRGKESIDIDSPDSCVAVAAVRCGKSVWEVYRGAESARMVARSLAVGSRATKELSAKSTRWVHASDPDLEFSGVARFENNVGTIAVASGENSVSAFAIARRVVEEGVPAALLERARAGVPVGDELRELLIASSDFFYLEAPTEAKCCECHRRLPLEKLGACPGRGCGAPLCGRCPLSCERCRSRDETRRAIRISDLEHLAEHFELASNDQGLLERDKFGSLVCRAARVDDDDDPAFLDVFDAIDDDGDGLLDFRDVATWAAERGERLERADFAPWPIYSCREVSLETTPVSLVLERGLLKLVRDQKERVAVVHPSVMDVERASATDMRVRAPSSEEETMLLSFKDEEACLAALTALAETLAICRRLRAPVVSLEPQPKREQRRGKTTTSSSSSLARAMDGVFRGGSGGGSGHSSSRKSVGFSDADEIEVSRGWAFDKVTTSTGVRWEAAPPRRAKEAYRAVVKLVIRPPRARYELRELGPRAFVIQNTSYIRTDFFVFGNKKLACSMWSEGAPPAPGPCVVYSHGNASCRLEALPHVAPLLLMGISVCAFDASGCGRSDGEFVSLGYREASDIAAVARYLLAQNRATTMALMGRSMGGVASILAASRYADFGGGVAKCVVADSPFASLEGLVDTLARTAAATAFSAPLPSDLAQAARPIDPDDYHNKKEGPQQQQQQQITDWWDKIPGVLAFSARSTLAEAAARAAVDSVRAEVEKRAAFRMDDVNAMRALSSLDAPLLLLAAEDDALVPPRPNSGALLDAYLARRDAKNTKNSLLEAQLVLCRGGHNARRPVVANRKIYYFLARHLLGLKDHPKKLRDKLQLLSPFSAHLSNHAPPWKYHHGPCSSKPVDDNTFVSGMTDARHKRAVKEISNIFNNLPS